MLGGDFVVYIAERPMIIEEAAVRTVRAKLLNSYLQSNADKGLLMRMPVEACFRIFYFKLIVSRLLTFLFQLMPLLSVSKAF